MHITHTSPASAPRPMMTGSTVATAAPAGGPGTELARLLAAVGIAPGDCACEARAREMDARGADWCISNVSVIVGWLRAEAARRKQPFNALAAFLLVFAATIKAGARRREWLNHLGQRIHFRLRHIQKPLT